MSSGIIEFFRRKLGGEKPLHPIDRRAAKHWVKQRLAHIFPELRNDPEALERAYRELDMEPRPGSGRGGETVFEAILPGRL
ncbi:MAG: hypothetical protein PHC88_06645 [Terrimicrobiaceae bacterium]|nr:hypothetical protein [Terrimicrobiaceae bacterium]